MEKQMTLEELMIPVAVPEGWSYAEQFRRCAEELNEAGQELHKHYDYLYKAVEAQESGDKKAVVHHLFQATAAKQAAAIEFGDVIETCVTQLSLLGYDLRSVMNAVYQKNKARNYYEEAPKDGLGTQAERE